MAREDEPTVGTVGLEVYTNLASLHTFNPRKAYQYVADLSVYIERQQHGKGIGTRLLQTVTWLGQELG